MESSCSWANLEPAKRRSLGALPPRQRACSLRKRSHTSKSSRILSPVLRWAKPKRRLQSYSDRPFPSTRKQSTHPAFSLRLPSGFAVKNAIATTTLSLSWSRDPSRDADLAVSNLTTLIKRTSSLTIEDLDVGPR